VKNLTIALFFFTFAVTDHVLAETKVAKVVLLRGKVKAKALSGKVDSLKKNDWVTEGSLIQTAGKSFVKLSFVDKSQMSLGPNSKMVVNKFSKKKAGLITLVKGQLKSKVTKDPLQREKNKMFIKTKTAAMGVRGTEFKVIFNEDNQNTALITLEGEVSMAKVDGPPTSINELQNRLDAPGVVSVKEGQYSGAGAQSQATVPVKISPAQLNGLKNNENFGTNNKKEVAKKVAIRNPVPPGLDVKKVMNENSSIEGEVAKAAGSEAVSEVKKEIQALKEQGPPPEGFVNPVTGEVAPPSGGPVDLTTGIYIPPPPGSTYDPNLDVYVIPPTLGSVGEDGSYLPPEGFRLEADGNFVVDAQAPPPGSPNAGANPQNNPAGSPSGGALGPDGPPPPPALITADQYGGEGYSTASGSFEEAAAAGNFPNGPHGPGHDGGALSADEIAEHETDEEDDLSEEDQGVPENEVNQTAIVNFNIIIQ
jgi:hypothetical protein